ncbi:MAG TPA: sulfatase-like hydrolase/transferase [Candidatus Hydrogenedentes bacterium]|nr:sulfatase-like hydrolase/transferase [Candidatus Hydrogenedentota bacterium]
MSAVYVLTLGLSSAVAGAFVHSLLARLGFAPTFELSTRLAFGGAAAYITVQLAWVALVKALKPTRARKFLLSECLSHLAAVVLIPYLLHIPIRWPDPALAKAEPLLFLGGYAALHAALKLFSFYTALYSEPSRRLPVLAWLGAAGVAAGATIIALHQWHAGIEAARPEAASMPGIYRAGGAYAEARPIPEGAMARYDLPIYENRGITLRWANLPDATPDEAVRRAYVTVVIEGEEKDKYEAAVSLSESAWATLRVPADAIPAGATRCAVFWTQSPSPTWMRLLGFLPVVHSSRQLLMSGPLLHRTHAEKTPPNLVLIGIDGLSSDRMSAWGYRRRTTPQLDRLVHSSVAFRYGYSPAPDASAAYMTCFTGVNPLCHGYFGGAQGPLPEKARTLAALLRENHYATAAFTEGEYRGDLEFGSGFENGFECFDAKYAEDEEGSQRTVEQACAWMDEHQDVAFMLFVRAGDLADAKSRERLGARPSNQPGPAKDTELYDAALESMDALIGGLIQHIRDSAYRDYTSILLFSPYGVSFGADGGQLAPELTEDDMRVPILYYAPEMVREKREYLVGLEDIAPALSRVAGLSREAALEGRSFLFGPVGKDPVSMMAKPFRLSVRSGNWRYVWEPGPSAFGELPAPGTGESALYRVGASTRRATIASEQKALVAELQKRLTDYVQSSYQWRGVAASAPAK